MHGALLEQRHERAVETRSCRRSSPAPFQILDAGDRLATGSRHAELGPHARSRVELGVVLDAGGDEEDVALDGEEVQQPVELRSDALGVLRRAAMKVDGRSARIGPGFLTRGSTLSAEGSSS